MWNTFEILNSELLKVDNAKSIEVSYGINYADRLNPLKDIKFLPFSSEKKIYCEAVWGEIEKHI